MAGTGSHRAHDGSPLPTLADPTIGKSDPKALARLTPQAYALASPLAIEDGLSIIDATREQARFAPDTLGGFAFGQTIASRRNLSGRNPGHGGAGVGYDLSPDLTVSATYSGEFGDGGRHAALVGLHWTF